MDNKYGVRWIEWGKDDRMQKKEKFFKTSKAREKFVEKLEKKDNFQEIIAWSDPGNLS